MGIPIGRQSGGDGASASDFTSSSWLDEHMELQSRIRDIRADLNKRDAFHDKGDVVSAHSTNVHAKKQLANAMTRVGTLASALQSLAMKGLSQGEIQRRSDMIARLQDDCEKLSKMSVAARLPTRALGSAMIGNQRPASESDQAALFNTGTGTATSRPVARVFGSAAVPKPQETEQTRPLDDQGLLMLQQEQMRQQDSQLSDLSAILLRQKQLGMAIGQEIGEQIDMIDDLSNNVDRVGGKLSSAKRQLNRVG
jgi:regulator of vacuolar morphogenesis